MKPIYEAIILFIGGIIADIVLLPHVLLAYGHTAASWWLPMAIASVQAVILFITIMKRTLFPSDIKVIAIFILLSISTALPSILMLHSCSVLTSRLDCLSWVFSRSHLTSIDEHTQLRKTNFYEIDTLVLNPALRITHTEHFSVSTGKYTSKTYLQCENMFLLKGRYDIWMIRCHWKPLEDVPDEKAMIRKWIAYDEYNNWTIGGKYLDVSKDEHYLNRINKALYQELAEEYERTHGRSKNTLALVSRPTILINSKTHKDEEPMLYTMVIWWYSFLYMFGIFARKEGELETDANGHVRHIFKQLFD